MLMDSVRRNGHGSIRVLRGRSVSAAWRDVGGRDGANAACCVPAAACYRCRGDRAGRSVRMTRRFDLSFAPRVLLLSVLAAAAVRGFRRRGALGRASLPCPRQARHADPVPDDRRRRLHRRGRRRVPRPCPLSRASAAGRAQSGAQGDCAAVLPGRLVQRLDQPARDRLRSYHAGARGRPARRSRTALCLLCRALEGLLDQRRRCRARAQCRAPGA